jgi:VCBS repeat-containing protein
MAILRNKETVEILKDLVETITLKVSGKDGAVWVDNLDGTYTLEVCKTYWFTVGDRFEDSVLLGIYHTITEVVKDTSITISSSMLPTNNEATLPTPLFYHGTIIAGTNELTNIRNHETESRPIIYLLEQFDETYFNEESSYDRISNLRLFFLLDSSYSWETPEHYTKVINPIRTLVNYFIDTVIKGNKLFDSEEIQEIDTTTRVRFGVYTSDRGTLVKALNEDYSGIEIRFSLPMFKPNVCCGDTIEYATCREASFEVKNTEGALLDSGTIPSGGYQLIEINTASCDPVTYNITRDGEPFASGSEPSGGSININVPSDCPAPEPCADGTVNVQKSDSTLISAVTVASGGAEPYLVADSVITLNDTTPTLISTTNVKATDNATIVAPDGVVTITDTTPTTLHTVNVKSNGVASQQITDSTVNVQKSDNTLIAAVNVKAQGTEPYNVADSEVNVNSVKLADVKATDTLNISVVDSTDTAVSVTLSGGNKITITDLPCAAPSCVDSYNLVDFFTLDRNNPFGNTNRFTAPNGTQTYTDGIVLDWFTGRDYAGTVFMFDVSILASNTHATQIAGEPYTVGGFNNFVVISQDHLYNLLNKGNVPPAEALNYAPFNHIVSTNPTRIRSRGDFYDNTTATWMYNATGQMLVLAKTTAVSSMLQRLTTYTELGL